MTEQTEQALRDATASAAMEGLYITDEQLQSVRDILNGRLTLQEYLCQLQTDCAG